MIPMSDHDHNGRPRNWQEPRSEPEIIPPDAGNDRARRIFIATAGPDGTRRVYIATPGLFTIVLALAILGLIAAVMLIVLLSVALIWIPVVIVLIAAFVLSVTFRRWWWRLRTWMAAR
jgi:hypothetical protein